MKYIDLHCDTASRLFYENQSLRKNEFSIDIEKMKKGNTLAQTFAFFIDIGEIKEPYSEYRNMYDNFINELNANKNDIVLVKNVDELNKADKNDKIGAFLSIEEGEVLEGKIENIKQVYDDGVRFITLTWNYKNKIGYPNYQYTYKDKGLTDLGIEMVREMERVGIVPDASHLSDGGFYDLINECKKPFIVTHSNSRIKKEHPRNLTDDMIKKLSDKGGIMGINFCSDFMGENEITSIDDMICHIKHIKNIGGIDVISLGSDFDGIENKVEIEDASKMNLLCDRLKNEGFNEADIEKIFYKNAIRFLGDTLK